MDLISVLVPVYNKELFIGKTLFSIDRQISIGDFGIEVIIVDDKSTDRSLELIEGYRWRYFKDLTVKIISNEKNLGPSASFNIALKASSGQFIAPLDGDDTLTQQSL